MAKIFQNGCPYCVLLVHGKSLYKKIFYLEKGIILLIFVTLVKDLGVLFKKIQQCRHNLFLAVQRTVMRKTGFLEKIKFFILFRTLTENYFFFSAKKFLWVLNTCREERLRKFLQKSHNSSDHSQSMSKELSIFLRKFFGRLVNIALWESRGKSNFLK